MAVRPARPDDVPRIAEIHVRSWQAAYDGLIPQDYLDGLDPAQRLAGWSRTVENPDDYRGGTLVVTDDRDRTMGFAHVRESRDADERDASVGEVWAIYLEREGWGKGLGRELMTAAVAYLTKLGYQQATLWVIDGNARARRFYEAAGFRIDGGVKVDDSRGFALREVRYRRALG
ncbi:MAG: GNAT family N-acetyltransferase [Actinobacteria bacterium]|nr:GNAT family N-acetyltransferase [Actinomycetota bacterium]